MDKFKIKTEDELLKEIDNMSYMDLLRKWRFAQAGDPMFRGFVGEYFRQQMEEKKPDNHSSISKEIGWNG
jgi:hypothetical protein